MAADMGDRNINNNKLSKTGNFHLTQLRTTNNWDIFNNQQILSFAIGSSHVPHSDSFFST